MFERTLSDREASYLWMVNSGEGKHLHGAARQEGWKARGFEGDCPPRPGSRWLEIDDKNNSFREDRLCEDDADAIRDNEDWWNSKTEKAV